MIKKFFSLLIFVCMIQSQNAFAHGSHGHGPVTEQQAISIASRVAGQFVDYDPGLGFGKLGSSWKQLTASDNRIHTRGMVTILLAWPTKQKEKRCLS